MVSGVFVSIGSVAVAQPAPRNAPLSLEEVVRLAQGGLSEELIVTRIKKNGKPFDLSTDEILELKKAGITDNVIKYLLDPSQPYTPPAPPPPKAPDQPAVPPKPAKKYPADAYASRVPAEPALYCLSQNLLVKVDVKLLLGEETGAGLGKVLLKKGRILGYLIGPAAKARVPQSAPTLYFRLPEGKGIEELLLVALESKNGRREVDMGPGPKPEIKPEALRQFDSVEVGAGLYRVTPAKLGKGEFLFYLIGSADPSKGNYGKVYDFGTDVPPAEKR